MIGAIIGGVTALVTLLLAVLGWIIYGMIIGASKKTGEHAWENREEYQKKGTELWEKGKGKWQK